MTVLQVKLLGPPEFWFEDHLLGPLTRKSTALLTWLAATGVGQARETAAELFWARNGLRNLRQELYVLRKLPGAAHWLVSDPTLSLRAICDVDSLSEGSDPHGLWRGAPGEGLDGVRSEVFQDWLAQFRNEMEERRGRCVVAWAREAMEARDFDAAQATLTPLLSEGVPNETIWKMSLEVRVQQGKREEAMILLEGARQRFDVRTPAWRALTRHLERPSPLQGVTPTGRRILEVSALAKTPLSVEVIAQALDVSPLSLVEELETLHAAALWPEGGMAPSTREQLLEGMPSHAAAILHGRLAVALEADGAPPEQLAPHIEAAGRRDAATMWLDLARRSGRLEAVKGALRTARSPRECTDAFLEGIFWARSVGDNAAADLHWVALKDHAVRTQEPRAVRQVPVQSVLNAAMRRDFDGADAAMALAVEALGADDSDVRAVHGIVCFLRGEHDTAASELEAGVAASEVTLRISAINALGALASMRGDADAAHQHHLKSLQEARNDGRLSMVSRLLNSLGANALSRHDVGVAADWLDQAHRLAVDVGAEASLPRIRFNLANVWIEIGAFGVARPLVAALVNEADTPLAQGRAFRCRAALERGVSRYAEAQRWSARARHAFEAGGDELQATVCRFNEALAGRHERGFEDIEVALQAVLALGQASLGRHAATELALVHSDPARVGSLLCEDPTGPLEIASHLRGALLGIDHATVHRPPMVHSVASAYGWALFAALHPEEAPPIRERLGARIARWEEGLLGSQREALHQRTQAWWTAPEEGF